MRHLRLMQTRHKATPANPQCGTAMQRLKHWITMPRYSRVLCLCWRANCTSGLRLWMRLLPMPMKNCCAALHTPAKIRRASCGLISCARQPPQQKMPRSAICQMPPVLCARPLSKQVRFWRQSRTRNRQIKAVLADRKKRSATITALPRRKESD